MVVAGQLGRFQHRTNGSIRQVVDSFEDIWDMKEERLFRGMIDRVLRRARSAEYWQYAQRLEVPKLFRFDVAKRSWGNGKRVLNIRNLRRDQSVMEREYVH